jgi:hypothetical protein
MTRCRVIQLKNGDTIRYQGQQPPSPQAIAALDKFVKAVKEQMKRGTI